MSSWTLIFTNWALKDAQLLRRANMWERADALLDVIRRNPFQYPPPYEKLRSDLRGMYSRRINRQHRLVYQVKKEERIIRVLQMWTHYE